MAQCGRRGGLKNRKLWVRIPLPALSLVGVAQIGRARARHARGWEFKPPRPLLRLLFDFLARLAEWIQARGCRPRQAGSIPAARSQYSPKWRNR